MSLLQPIREFGTEAEFQEVQRRIADLVSAGKLKPKGTDPSEPSFFVERYLTETGELWLLAVPDQAFRGYLRKA